MNPTDIITTAAAVTTFVKILVDIVKTSPIPSPGAVVPALALVISVGVSFLYALAQGTAIHAQSAAQIGLVAILATGGSIGVTALQNKANEPKP